MEFTKNLIKLYGQVCSPMIINKVGAVNFYLSVSRRTGVTKDILPCTASEDLLSYNYVEEGDYINLVGEVQTSMGLNRETGLYNKLYVFNYAKNISNITKKLGTYWKPTGPNELKICGNICKKAKDVRITPFGKKVYDFTVAVETSRDKNYSDHNAYIPCIAFGDLAERIQSYKIGDLVSCKGMLQSRDYQKGGFPGELFKRTAYEASIFTAVNTGENNRRKE